MDEINSQIFRSKASDSDFFVVLAELKEPLLNLHESKESISCQRRMTSWTKTEPQLIFPHAAANPCLSSTIARENDDSAHRKTKGHGFREEKDSDRQRCLSLRDFESLGSDGGPGPQRSIEGWINLVTAVHEEAQEDDISNAFGDFGQIKSLHVNLDRLTGFVKEYAYLDYEKSKEAQNAIKAMNGAELLTQNVNVDWAFCNGPSAGSYRKKNMRFLCVNLGFCPATTTQGCILSDFEKIADFLRKAAHITSVLHRKYGKPHKDLCGSL